MAYSLARHETRSYRPVRLTIAALAAVACVVLVLRAESSWQLSTSPWFALSVATVAAILRVELDRS